MGPEGERESMASPAKGLSTAKEPYQSHTNLINRKGALKQKPFLTIDEGPGTCLARCENNAPRGLTP